MSEEEKRQFIVQLDRWNDAAVIDPAMIDAEFDDFDPEVLKYRLGQMNDRVWQRILESGRKRPQAERRRPQ